MKVSLLIIDYLIYIIVSRINRTAMNLLLKVSRFFHDLLKTHPFGPFILWKMPGVHAPLRTANLFFLWYARFYYTFCSSIKLFPSWGFKISLFCGRNKWFFFLCHFTLRSFKVLFVALYVKQKKQILKKTRTTNLKINRKSMIKWQGN